MRVTLKARALKEHVSLAAKVVPRRATKNILLDALKHIDTDRCVIGIVDHLSPLSLRPTGTEDQLHLIMPKRL